MDQSLLYAYGDEGPGRVAEPGRKGIREIGSNGRIQIGNQTIKGFFRRAHLNLGNSGAE